MRASVEGSADVLGSTSRPLTVCRGVGAAGAVAAVAVGKVGKVGTSLYVCQRNSQLQQQEFYGNFLCRLCHIVDSVSIAL